MKTSKLFFFSLALSLIFVSCETENQTNTLVVDFENVALNSDSIWDGSDLSGTPKQEDVWGSTVTNYYGSFTADSTTFENVYTSDWFSWKGFACSAKTDKTTEGYGNQYSVIAGSGAYNSEKFAVAYDSASVICPSNAYGNFKIKSMMLTNSTYSYLAMKNGTEISKVFTTGDWFKVIIKGYLAGKEVGSVDYYLADFRDGKNFMSDSWNKVDLSSIGEVDRLSFTFDSSDKAYGYINNPTYVCVDNIEFAQTISTK